MEKDSDMNDGWIEWNGVGCPVKSGMTIGFVKFRNGEISTRENHPIAQWSWDKGGPYAIIAYRITENHEPAETAPVDMSQNRVPWGLLTDAEHAALEVWLNSCGKVEQWDNTNQMWRCFNVFGFAMSPSSIYRTVAPPVITDVTEECFIGGHLVTVILHLHDGKPISGTVDV